MAVMVVIITGASRGLGRETALALGRLGHSLVVVYRKAGDAAREVVRQIDQEIDQTENGGANAISGQTAFSYQADISHKPDVVGLLEATIDRWGRVDALINNAGIAMDSLLLRQPEDGWDKVIQTNLTGCFHTTQVISNAMKDSGGGHILNISSRSGLMGKEGQAAYSASKAALLGLTRSAALELGAFNVRVNALLPGYMPTDMGAQAKEAMQRAQATSALGCLSDPAEVAGFIAWLIQTNNITGQVFSLDSRITI